MRLISKTLERDSSGSIVLLPEEIEDMWHVYNLISKDDLLKATTIRRLQSQSTTGSVTSERIRMALTISVESVDFDANIGLLRINGRVARESPHVKMGSYHTIDLEMNRQFTLFKPEWDIIALERVSDACDVSKKAEVVAIVCQEGLANLCFLTAHMTIVRQRIEMPIPRKRRGSTANHEKGLQRFYDQIYEGILRLIDFDVTKAIVIASPGFVKDQLYTYIFDQATKTNNKLLFENKSKFILVHCSSGHKHSLNEVMQDPTMQAKLSDTKAAREIKALDDFYHMLNQDSDRAYYGYKHVFRAHEHGAIGVLLVSDDLFRSSDISTRKKYIALVEQVRATGGTVHIFSSLHVSGEQLNLLTGVAAILTFPLPEPDDDELNQIDQDRPAV